MCRLLSYLLALCIIPCTLAAQDKIFGERDERRFHAGFTGGVNFCEVIGDAYHGYHKVGYYGGAIVYGSITKEIFGSLGIQYAKKGSRGIRPFYSQYVGEMFEHYYLDLQYVEIPLSVHIWTKRWLWLGGGLVYGRLLSWSERVETDQPVVIRKEDWVFNRDDLAFTLSAVIRMNDHWMLNAGYLRSLKPIRQWYNVHPYLGSGHQYNIHFNVGLTYLL